VTRVHIKRPDDELPFVLAEKYAHQCRAGGDRTDRAAAVG
jgi:hypothetical protein